VHPGRHRTRLHISLRQPDDARGIPYPFTSRGRQAYRIASSRERGLKVRRSITPKRATLPRIGTSDLSCGSARCCRDGGECIEPSAFVGCARIAARRTVSGSPRRIGVRAAATTSSDHPAVPRNGPSRASASAQDLRPGVLGQARTSPRRKDSTSGSGCGRGCRARTSKPAASDSSSTDLVPAMASRETHGARSACSLTGLPEAPDQRLCGLLWSRIGSASAGP
jgi:hypothetical protein